jgi:hypothetical protein
MRHAPTNNARLQAGLNPVWALKPAWMSTNGLFMRAMRVRGDGKARVVYHSVHTHCTCNAEAFGDGELVFRGDDVTVRPKTGTLVLAPTSGRYEARGS